ncbi:MAG: DNA translocase FtsK 4TM domain-containing protein [Ruminococcus sp.]
MAAKKSANNTTKSSRNTSQKKNAKGSGKANSAPKKNKQEKEPKQKNYRVRAILLLASGVLFACLLFVDGNFLWNFFRNSVYGIFGSSAILITLFLFYVAILTAKEKEIHRLRAKIVMCFLVIFFSSMEFYIFTGAQYGNYFEELSREFLHGYDGYSLFDRGGGILGSFIGYPMCYTLGKTVTAIIATLGLVVTILITTGVSLLDIAKAAKKPVDKARRTVEERKRHREEMQEEYIDFNENQPVEPTHYSDHIDIPIDDKKKRKRNRKQKDNLQDNSEKEFSLAKDREETDDLIDIIKRANKGLEDSSLIDDEESKGKRREKSKALKEAAKLANQGIKVEEIESETLAMSRQIESNERVKHSDYQFPPVQLLKLPNNKSASNIRNEMQEKAEKLVSTLDSFGVKVSITNICRGPSVTRYELQPAPGVKISKITNLADDIALNLAANGVRIEAPIPGKAAVGIEVPNKVVSMVSMRELIDSDEFRDAKSKLTCVLGRDISGEIVTTDLAKLPHLLIAGTTGSGKSVCVNSLLMSILYRATPDEVKLLLIDPKMVEFSKYKGIPHLLIPVVSDAKKAAAALNWAVSEMLQRYQLFSEYDCKDINSYNDLIESNLKFIEEQTPAEGEEPEVMEINGLPVPKEKMFRCVIAIDELADLMMAAPSEVEESICRLAQMARAAGMHLVIATQRPSVNVITGVIKANIPSRIALKVSSNIDSRTILDFGGAEKLIGRGDMLYSPVGAPKPVRVQGCFASDSEIEGVTSYIKNHHRSQYNEEVEERIKKITVEGMEAESGGLTDDSGAELDEKIEEAIKIVIDAGQASTSLVQRRLKVGYARAGRMIDEMEGLGIVGPHQGSKPREVLMTYQEWLERRNIQGDNGGEEISPEE